MLLHEDSSVFVVFISRHLPSLPFFLRQSWSLIQLQEWPESPWEAVPHQCWNSQGVSGIFCGCWGSTLRYSCLHSKNFTPPTSHLPRTGLNCLCGWGWPCTSDPVLIFQVLGIWACAITVSIKVDNSFKMQFMGLGSWLSSFESTLLFQKILCQFLDF